MKCSAAANGQEALHVAREHKGAPIRLVVTDVIMPLMGGKVMAEWLKTTYPDLKILFTSGYTDDAIATTGSLTGSGVPAQTLYPDSGPQSARDARCAADAALFVNKLKHLSAGKLVGFAFATLCAFLLLIGGWFYFSLRAIERGNQLEQSRALKKLAVIDDIGHDVGQMQAAVVRQVLLPTSTPSSFSIRRSVPSRKPTRPSFTSFNLTSTTPRRETFTTPCCAPADITGNKPARSWPSAGPVRKPGRPSPSTPHRPPPTTNTWRQSTN